MNIIGTYTHTSTRTQTPTNDDVVDINKKKKITKEIKKIYNTTI
jgi:hypothetical protein